MKSTLKIIRSVLSWALTFVLMLVFVMVMFQRIAGQVPGVFGYHLMYVLTGSMEPEIMTGDAIIVREADGENVSLGDIISYYSKDEEIKGQLVTHEVIKAPYEEDGIIYLQTKGIANSTADDPITADQVLGVMIYKLGVLGKVYSFFQTVPGLIVCILPIVFLIGNEIRGLRKCVKEERRELVERFFNEPFEGDSHR